MRNLISTNYEFIFVSLNPLTSFKYPCFLFFPYHKNVASFLPALKWIYFLCRFLHNFLSSQNQQACLHASVTYPQKPVNSLLILEVTELVIFPHLWWHLNENADLCGEGTQNKVRVVVNVAWLDALAVHPQFADLCVSEKK